MNAVTVLPLQDIAQSTWREVGANCLLARVITVSPLNYLLVYTYMYNNIINYLYHAEKYPLLERGRLETWKLYVYQLVFLNEGY